VVVLTAAVVVVTVVVLTVVVFAAIVVVFTSAVVVIATAVVSFYRAGAATGNRCSSYTGGDVNGQGYRSMPYRSSCRS